VAVKPLAADLARACPLFLIAAGLGFVGATLLIASLQAVECGCFVLRRG